MEIEEYSVEEFRERWDELIKRVEGGEHIGIVNEHGTRAVMIPAEDNLIRLYKELNNDAP
jgi:PHD/YefM family antitoxin component YafN of YafNO toxin-antitoxin module